MIFAFLNADDLLDGIRAVAPDLGISVGEEKTPIFV